MSHLLARRSWPHHTPDTELPFTPAHHRPLPQPEFDGADAEISADGIDLDLILDRLAARDDDQVGDAAPDLLRDVILPSDLLRSADCHDIYRQLFQQRMESLIGGELPAVRAYAGDELFSRLVAELIACQQPTPGLLGHAGEALAVSFSQSHLLETGQSVWLAELASLELSIERATRAPVERLLELDELLELPFERWASARLEPVASLQLSCFEHRVDELYQAWLLGEALPAVDARPQWLAVLRQGPQVQRIPMSRRAWLLLSGLCLGRPVASSFFDSLGWSTRKDARRRAHLWLRTWVENGFFKAVHADV